MTRPRQQDAWAPSLRGRTGPRYRAIADAIAADIASGRLAPGQPLPTQRELADRLGINFTTVTRAYTEARRRGLITATVGRGTFVADPRQALRVEQPGTGGGDFDLSVNAPPLPVWLAGTFRETLDELQRQDNLALNVLTYGARLGDVNAREAGVAWLRDRGLEADADRVVVTAGAQHALSILLSTFARPGETVLAESLAYPGLLTAAEMAGVRVIGVAMDDEGLLPDALDALCERHRPALMFTVPTLQNPTTAVMSPRRRREIVAVARRRVVRIVEDDICGALYPEAAPLATLAPEHVIHIASLSKCVAPGLRTGFVLVPDAADATRLDAAVRTSVLMVSPLPLAVASTWILDGTAARVVSDVQREATARTKLARAILGEERVEAPAGSLHAWLRLPASWTLAAFVAQAQQLGVRVGPGDWYVTPTEPMVGSRSAIPAAVRVALGAEPDRERLAQALRSLARLLEQPPRMRATSL
jgi:DNA-binding transcriptional MocR family regulator